MSADNAIYIQKNAAGQFVFQHGFLSADEPPNPEEARDDEKFDSLEKGFYQNLELAKETEYGFRVLIPSERFPTTEKLDIFAADFEGDPERGKMRVKYETEHDFTD